MKKLLFIALAVFTVIFFTGCPVHLSFTSLPDDNLNIHFDTTAGSAINELIASFDGSAKAGTIFDTLEIEKALTSEGFTKVSATTVKVPSDQETLTILAQAEESQLDFIRIEKNSNGAATKLYLTLSPEILQNLISNQNSIIQRYADLLMAPCFTDEAMDKDEYSELVASLYGQQIADELLNGQITLSLKNSLIYKKTQGVSIPLIDILTLTSKKTFIVEF